MIKNMGKEYLLGMMGENLLELGMKGNNLE